MNRLLRVIHLEDCQEDFELVGRLLQDDGLKCAIQRVEGRSQLEEALESPCDLILSDCTLPQFHGLEALQMARAMQPEVPFIFVSGTIGEETAIKSLQNGATDYVLKQRLSRLAPAVRRALTEAEGRKTQRAMEAQLRQSRKLATIATLTGGLAHDFRNILQVQKLNIDLLALVAHEPDQVVRVAGQLQKMTDRGCAMMQELLVFARKTDANLGPVDLAARVRETAQMLRISSPANVSLCLELEEDLPHVMADAGQVDRMLTNLILNARDALSDGGEIVVSTDLVRFDRAHASSWQIEDVPYLRVQVSDNGTGMDEATQARVFEPFFTTKLNGKGTGLGLSVVFGLIEAHQGFIDLQSAPGEGSTFSLFFPLSSKPNVAPERIREISPVCLLGRTAQAEMASV